MPMWCLADAAEQETVPIINLNFFKISSIKIFSSKKFKRFYKLFPKNLIISKIRVYDN
jgi:hypothetical protein